MWTADKIIYNGIDTYIKAYQGNMLVWEKTIPEDPADDITLPYVTFRAEEAGSTIGLAKTCYGQTLEYSTDKSKWNTFDTTSNITLSNVDDEVYVRGILPGDFSSSLDYAQFKMTGKIAAYGNINALWYYYDLKMPLKDFCGYKMFSGCTSLTKAPELPATTLAKSCYAHMFEGCTSLTVAPELPATDLAVNCYSEMFRGCTSLTKAPKLPATDLASHCYYYMFEGCTSLTVAPELPATELYDYCYYSMFYNCTSLTVAPELPATELYEKCYNNMFYNCTSLTVAPKLPATTLVKNCYSNMFNGCTSLQEITCLATDISASGCLYNWVLNVASTGLFYKDPSMTSWSTSYSGIPSGWTVLDYTA